MCGGVHPAVGVFEAGDVRCAGAGDGESAASAECWRFSYTSVSIHLLVTCRDLLTRIFWTPWASSAWRFASSGDSMSLVTCISSPSVLTMTSCLTSTSSSSLSPSSCLRLPVSCAESPLEFDSSFGSLNFEKPARPLGLRGFKFAKSACNDLRFPFVVGVLSSALGDEASIPIFWSCSAQG